MSLKHVPLIMVLSASLLGCSTAVVSTKKDTALVTTNTPLTDTATVTTNSPELAVETNLNKLCNPHLYIDHIILPPPPLTGTERQTPIVLMTRQQFNEKIQQSPLWESVYDKELQYGSYGEHYSLKKMGELIGANSYISVYSNLDGRKWQENQRITSLVYSNAGIYKRIPYGHQLLDQERYEMIEMVTMVIEDRDKATEIVDKLYQQYLQKVNNKDYLSDGETIHTHIKYDGKYFSMRGAQRLDHKIEQCNYKLLSGLVIN